MSEPTAFERMLARSLSEQTAIEAAAAAKRRLDWWHTDDRDRWWAYAPKGCYVVTRAGAHWNVARERWRGRHRRRHTRRLLGSAATLAAAMAIAQTDHEKPDDER
jgi:hypothetical protein